MFRRLPLLVLPWVLSAFASVQAQDFAGPWTMSTPSGGAVTVTFQLDARGRATGSLAGNGNSFPLQGERQGGGIVGQATIPGGALHFEANQSGDELTMVLAEVDAQGQPNPQTSQELHFTRQGASSQGIRPQPGFATGEGGMGGNTQLGQLLLSSKWCSFSYSGTSDNSGSGSSHSSKVQFFPDGTAVQTTGGETYSGGNNGSVAGQSSGGQRYYWQVQGNTLQVSADRAQWVPVNLQVTRNSNGYPIVTADGTEYMQCN